jgi:glycyl-tRNA synthetase beta chain
MEAVTMTDTRDFLFELGTEELPPKSLLTLSRALESNVRNGLAKASISHGDIVSYATPRRLALWIKDLAKQQPDQVVEKRGPALNAAYTPDGAPSKALEGFARSCGTTVDQLIRLQTDKGEWLGYKQEVKGQATAQLLPDILRLALAALPIAKRMRWGAGEAEFVRPVQWLVLLSGDEVIETEILGTAAGRLSYGHRFHAPAAIRLDSPAEYADKLRAARVIASFDERRQQIRHLANEAAAGVHGVAHIEEDLLDEVAALVEWPMPVLGGFDARYLALPKEVPITTMQANQKYFPVMDTAGKLLPHFITFANLESKNPASVRQGNERVVRPRLADGEFFWNQDRKKTLESRVLAQGQIVFQNKLGSLLDKTQRVQKLAKELAEQLEADATLAQRAAYLAKADLLTEMVGEFPELQGTMGRYYALAEGEPAEVAHAIEEQYLPKGAGGELPASQTGQVLSLAEKLDTLTGIFSAGLIPSGDKDPYALRRAALGVVRIAIEKGLEFDLPETLGHALAAYHHAFDRDATQKAVLDFIHERLKSYSLDKGYTPDEFEAVLGVAPGSLHDFARRLSAVAEFRQLPEAESLAAANKRIRNILRKAEGETVGNVDDQLLAEPAEQALFAAAQQARTDTLYQLESRDYTGALQRLAQLRPEVDAFFDSVMVMAEDPAVRQNRLGLLALLEGLFLDIADISKLQSAAA